MNRLIFVLTLCLTQVSCVVISFGTYEKEVQTLSSAKSINDLAARYAGKNLIQIGEDEYKVCEGLKWSGAVVGVTIVPIPLIFPAGRKCSLFHVQEGERITMWSFKRKEEGFCCGLCFNSRSTLGLSPHCGK